MRRRRTPVAAALTGVGGALLLVTTLAGCGPESTADGSPSASKSSSASASSTPTDTDSTSPTPTGGAASPSASPSRYAHNQPTALPHDRLAAGAFHVAALQSSVAKTAEEKAVVASWMGFWQAASDTYYYGSPVKNLSLYSTGAAKSGILHYLAQQKHDKERVVGWARDNVTSVQVAGSRATVKDCTRNFTFTTDLEGEPLSHPDKWYDASGVLEKQGGRWVVVSQQSPARKTSCLS